MKRAGWLEVLACVPSTGGGACASMSIILHVQREMVFSENSMKKVKKKLRRFFNRRSVNFK